MSLGRRCSPALIRDAQSSTNAVCDDFAGGDAAHDVCEVMEVGDPLFQQVTEAPRRYRHRRAKCQVVGPASAPEPQCEGQGPRAVQLGQCPPSCTSGASSRRRWRCPGAGRPRAPRAPPIAGLADHPSCRLRTTYASRTSTASSARTTRSLEEAFVHTACQAWVGSGRPFSCIEPTSVMGPQSGARSRVRLATRICPPSALAHSLRPDLTPGVESTTYARDHLTPTRIDIGRTMLVSLLER